MAFCSYGAFWISFYFIVHSAADVSKGELFSGLGLYLWMWGIFTAYMFIASLRTTAAISLVFLLLTAVGWRVLPVTWEELVDRPADLVALLRRAQAA